VLCCCVVVCCVKSSNLIADLVVITMGDSVVSALTVGTSSHVSWKPPEYPEKLDTKFREIQVKRKELKDAQEEEVIDDDPYGGFSSHLDHGIVFKRIDNHMEDLITEETWITARAWTTTLAWVMALAGSFLIVISNTIIKTVVFQSQPELLSLCILGFIMWYAYYIYVHVCFSLIATHLSVCTVPPTCAFVSNLIHTPMYIVYTDRGPWLVWFWLYFFPNATTKLQRKTIRAKRKVRQKIFFFGELR
jgi:hypothetical protein